MTIDGDEVKRSIYVDSKDGDEVKIAEQLGTNKYMQKTDAKS